MTIKRPTETATNPVLHDAHVGQWKKDCWVERVDEGLTVQQKLARRMDENPTLVPLVAVYKAALMGQIRSDPATARGLLKEELLESGVLTDETDALLQHIEKTTVAARRQDISEQVKSVAQQSRAR